MPLVLEAIHDTLNKKKKKKVDFRNVMNATEIR